MGRALVRLVAVCVAVCATLQIAAAQTNLYKIVVPFAPGGGQDVLARVIAPELGNLLGATVIIENRAGAGSAVGATYVARSTPDGTTLLMAASSHVISALLNKKSPIDPIKDFTPVAHVGTGGYILIVNARVPAKNAGELIAYGKNNPGKLNYASAGVGSATHLASAYFASRAGLNLVHVPYKSTAEALNSTMRGDTQILIVPTLGSQGFISNPDLRVLGVVSKHRVSSLPDIPTVDESGLPGFEFSSWFGLLGPANMPPDITEKLNGIMAKIIAMPEVAKMIDLQGVEPRSMSSKAFADLLQGNYDTTRKILESTGIAAE